jgi:hypothetical protein
MRAADCLLVCCMRRLQQTCDREQIQGMLRVANSQKPSFATRALNHRLQPYYETIGKYVGEVVDYWWARATPAEKGNLKKWGKSSRSGFLVSYFLSSLFFLFFFLNFFSPPFSFLFFVASNMFVGVHNTTGAALHHYMGFPVHRDGHGNNDLYFDVDAHKDAGNCFSLEEMSTNPQALKVILTDYIFRISVMHSADHWGRRGMELNIGCGAALTSARSVLPPPNRTGFMQVPCDVSPMVMRIPYSRNGYVSETRPPWTRLDDFK